ncbi:Ger(x)C family spore germination protein [Brevibacillus massiliensis]|uniref:Ger(x)C family spore germination protein n=1 Tax=Brevibacillus massiliensis TaxID=1118054 RepID=UPI000310168B|nr:Ger(x)C family spore germination protein [Brevibacillus massiliensis]
MSKARCWIALLLALSLLLGGCWDRRELEERTSVLGMGIDLAKGKPNLLKVTVQIPIPIKIAGSGGQTGGKGGGSPVRVMSSTGHTVLEAISNLQKRLNQKIFIGHARVVAVSEEVARRGLREITDGFRRDPEMRRLLWPIVVKKDAAHLLKVKPKLEQIPIVYIMDMIESGTKTGSIPDQTLGNFYIQDSSRTMQPYLNYMVTHNDEIIWKGVAVFREDKMVGVLPELQTWVLNQLRDNKTGGDIVIAVPGKKGAYITVRPHFVRTKLKLEQAGNQTGSLQARYVCRLQCDLLEATFPLDFKDNGIIHKYEQIIRQEMEKRAAKLINMLQKDFKSDILKLGLAIHGHHYRDYWVSHNWVEEFPRFPISVQYDVHIRRIGMKMK